MTLTSNQANKPPPLKPTAQAARDGEEFCRECGEPIQLSPGIEGYQWRHVSEWHIGVPGPGHKAEPGGRGR